MMSDTCTLCGLSTEEGGFEDPDVEGTFCCQGCLEVARTVGAVDNLERADIQTRLEDDPLESEGAGAEAFLGVDGMHCTTCEAFLALHGEEHDGIQAVDASYATDTIRVRYDPDVVEAGDLPSLLSGYGYTARYRDEREPDATTGAEETLQRLLIGAFLALLIMPWYIFFLYPKYVGLDMGLLRIDMTSPVGLYLPMGIVAVLAGIVVLYTGWPILRGAYVSIRAGKPNMDLLLSVAILGAYAYSTVALATGSIHLYYDVSVAIVLVVTAGSYYEGKVKRQATGMLSDLTALRVSEATRRRPDGSTETVSIEDIAPGDELLVRPGERIPIDGTVVDGIAAVDEAIVTGEAMPSTKRPGDEVIGGSLVTDTALVVAVDPSGQSTLDRITALLWTVQSERSGVQRFADRLSTVFVPVVLVLGIMVVLWRLSAGDPVDAAVLGGLTVLVAACPCAMGLATPLAIAGGLRDAVDRGIVVTNNSLFEFAPSVDTVVFDKTGTLTAGEMAVQSVVGEESAVRLAAIAERRSSHPIATAIQEFATPSADGGQITDPEPTTGPAEEVSEFERHPGQGISATVGDQRIVVGTPDLVTDRAGSLTPALQSAVETAREAGTVPVVIGREGEAVAVAIVGDTERDEWADVMESLAEKRIVVLTGDDESAARRFGAHAAVDDVLAGVPPDGKAATVERLRSDGTTAMVGDGTNDAPALGTADVGIAIAGSAHAADAADVVLVKGSLCDVPTVFQLANATRRRIRENVGWALCYNGIAIPLAIAGLLNPLLAALAMAGSSLLVVTNSRRSLI